MTNVNKTFKEMLNEKEESKGTYSAVVPSKESLKDIVEFMSSLDIENPLDSKDIHCTLLYSRKEHDDYTPPDKVNYVGTTKKFTVFQGDNNKNILVLELESKDLKERHEYLMKKYGATYDYPEYISHITLSYDIKDKDKWDGKKISDTMDEFDIVFDEEYKEDLNLDWQNTKDEEE